jgi:hypothetical protein
MFLAFLNELYAQGTLDQKPFFISYAWFAQIFLKKYIQVRRTIGREMIRMINKANIDLSTTTSL